MSLGGYQLNRLSGTSQPRLLYDGVLPPRQKITTQHFFSKAEIAVCDHHKKIYRHNLYSKQNYKAYVPTNLQKYRQIS
jgi:hypothetical protein